MTTSVEIFAHNWPVNVVALDRGPDGAVQPLELGTVEPGQTIRHSVWSTRQLLITEMLERPAPEEGEKT